MNKRTGILLLLLWLCGSALGCEQKVVLVPTSTPSVTATPTAEPTAEPTLEPSGTPTATSAGPEGWAFYVNEDAGYQFYHPADAIITESGPQGFPANEIPAGKTFDEYIAMLQELYGSRLCVSVEVGLGVINISAAANANSRYTICGRTGVGVGTIIHKEDVVVIEGQPTTASGFEFVGPDSPCEVLSCHNDWVVLDLPDGTRIGYGSMPHNGTYAEYLATTRPVLLQIVGSFAFKP